MFKLTVRVGCVVVLHTKLCCVCMLVVLVNVSMQLYIHIECYVDLLCTLSVFKLPAGCAWMGYVVARVHTRA